MAKTAEQKAAEAAAKEAKKAAEEQAKAAKKAAEEAAKQAKLAEKAQLEQVKAAQRAEILLLKEQGVPKTVIKQEAKANTAELKEVKTTLAAPGQQTITPPAQPTFFSAPAAYTGPTQQAVQSTLQNAATKYETLGISNVGKVGETTTGLGIDKLVSYDLGKAGNQATKTIERAQQFVGQTFTPQQLAAEKVKVKEVKDAPGVFQYKTGDSGNNIYTFFQKDANGNFVGTGVNRTATPQADGGLFNSPLGNALGILGVTALALTPGGQAFAGQVGAALSGGALSGAAAQALGQAVIRGTSTGVITGDVEKGLVAGAISGAGSALNLSGTTGKIFDAVGLGDYKDAFGVISTPSGTLPSLGEGAFDMGGAAGAGILDEALPQIAMGPGTTITDITGGLTSGGIPISELTDAEYIAELTKSVQQVVGNDPAAIQQSLIAAGVDPVAAASAANMAATGSGAGTIAADLSGMFGGAANLFPGVTTGALTGFGGAAPITDLSFPFDQAAYDQTAGLGGALSGAAGLGGAALETVASGNALGAIGAGLGMSNLFGGGGGGGGFFSGLFGGGGGGGGGGLEFLKQNNLLNQLLGNLPGLAGTAIDVAALNRISKEAQGLGQQLGREATQIGAQNQTAFTPYTLTTGAGTATITPGSATATAAAPYEALRQQALTQAQQTLGAINPAQATQQFYGNLEALAAPTRQREQEQLLSSLGARGLLGIGRNLPTAGGGVRGVNPYQEALLSAQEQGRIQQALQAQQFGTSEAIRQQGLAQALQSQAMGIDTQTMQQLAQARQLGLDERALAQSNARLRAETALKGLELRAPYEQLGLLGQIQGITAAAGGARGLLGLPTQAGNTSSGGGGLLGSIFNSLLNQGFSANDAANYVNSISSGLDISGNSQGTQNLIDDLQQYGIF